MGPSHDAKRERLLWANMAVHTADIVFSIPEDPGFGSAGKAVCAGFNQELAGGRVNDDVSGSFTSR